MFAQRFDPGLLRKRKMSDASESGSDSGSESGSGSGSESNKSDSSSDSESDSDELSDETEQKEQREQEEEKEKQEQKQIETQTETSELPDQTKTKSTDPIESDQNIENDASPMEVDEEIPEFASKHASVYRKLQSAVTQEEEEEEEEEDVELHNLEPLPQPALPEDEKLVANNSHFRSLDWLAEPTYALPDVTKPFDDFGMSKFLVENLVLMGFKSAFSVQVSVLNILLHDIKRNQLQPDFQGDVLVNASTGSGKTLAYLVPIVEALHSRVVPQVRALILVPTRPLITQVAATFALLTKGTSLSVVTLKSDISLKEESAKIKQNIPDIIVTTPGRLVDHISMGSVNLQYLRFMVIDEADRLLNQSFQNWCNILVSTLESHEKPEDLWSLKPQKLIFSATLTTDAGKLSGLKFQKPRLVIVNAEKELVNELFSVPPTLQEYNFSFTTAQSGLKPLLLCKFLMQENKLSNVLVFAKSNEASLRLSKLLSLLFARLMPARKVSVHYINSTNNLGSIRSRILRDFSEQNINILVATDLIARGIDIASITDVVNYDLPHSSREYVHRVGRTARANQTGFAYTFCFGRGEGSWFKNIMKDVGRGGREVSLVDVQADDLVGEDEKVYAECLEELQQQIYK